MLIQYPRSHSVKKLSSDHLLFSQLLLSLFVTLWKCLAVVVTVVVDLAAVAAAAVEGNFFPFSFLFLFQIFKWIIIVFDRDVRIQDIFLYFYKLGCDYVLNYFFVVYVLDFIKKSRGLRFGHVLLLVFFEKKWTISLNFVIVYSVIQLNNWVIVKCWFRCKMFPDFVENASNPTVLVSGVAPKIS